MPEISGYHHLNLTVPDLERSWLIVFRDPDNIQLEVYAHGK